MKRVLAAVVLTAWLLLVGCGEPVAPHGSISELRIHRQKWLSKRPSEYSYHVVLNTGIGYVGTVHVTNGEARVFANPGTPVAAPWASIEAAFDRAEQSLAGSLYEFEVEYDPTLGYPRRIWINPEKLTADDEWGFTVTDFRLSVTTLQ